MFNTLRLACYVQGNQLASCCDKSAVIKRNEIESKIQRHHSSEILTMLLKKNNIFWYLGPGNYEKCTIYSR